MQQGGNYKPLTEEELSALSHQFRGSNSDKTNYTSDFGTVKNSLGYLTPREKSQLQEYMNKSGTLEKVWQGLPNLLGNSGSAAIPKDSRLKIMSERSSYFPGENGYTEWLKFMEQKGYKKGGMIPYYQTAGEVERLIQQGEGMEDFSFLYPEQQIQEPSSSAQVINAPIATPNVSNIQVPNIPMKQTSGDDLSFGDWYKTQLQLGKAGDVAEWRGKKYLLDPRDFAGYKAPQQRSSSQQSRPVQNNAAPNFNWLQDRRQAGISMITDLPNRSSRSNTPVKPIKPTTQEQNTSFLTHPATTLSKYIPNVDFGNPVLNYLHSVSPQGMWQGLAKGTLDAISRLGSGIGEGSKYEDTPWYINPVFDALSVFGAAGAGSAARGAGNAGTYGQKAAEFLPKMVNQVTKMGQSKIPALSKELIKRGINESKAGEALFKKIRNSQGYLQRMNNIGKEEAAINLQREISSLPKTAQKKITAILNRLNKAEAEYQMGGAIPLFDYEQPMVDETMIPMDYMEDGGIYIKPQNRGKFTASANRVGMGVQEFARHVLSNPEDYSPLQRKRANFARNAKSWS